MSLILAWVAFPLVLAAIGAGWGALVEGVAAARLDGALLVPLGLAAALVVAGTLTAFTATTRAAVPVVAVGAVGGLVFARRRWRVSRWPVLAALGVLFAYGAPVLLSGQATFTGFIKLDDTATWFNVIDHVFSHSRSVASEPPSTYSLVYSGDVGPAYPLGSFVLPGVGRALTGIDIAWVFQPYMACCAAAVALSVFALIKPVVASPRIRALAAFAAAQPALLYGYSLWGGIKELTAAFLLALGAALAAAFLPRRPEHWRELLPLALAAGALIQTLGVGAGGLVAPALVLIAAAWGLLAWRSRKLGAAATSVGSLGVFTAASIVPVWVVAKTFLAHTGGFYTAGQSSAEKLGNLIQPLSGFQLAGIWPVGDFRRGQNKYLFLTAPSLLGAILVGLVLVAAAVGLFLSVRRRQFGLAFYVAVSLIGSAVFWLGGATPWVTGKVLAVSAPALLTAALTSGAMLWGMHAGGRVVGVAGALTVAALVGGVLWSNALAYHDATIAPRPRLAELQHIGDLLAGKGPTFVNAYEIYADRHFLRDGHPVEPAEYRPATLSLRTGTVLTKGAAADLDSFPLSTLEPYRSLVTARTPTESRPPSIYKLVWQGNYYQLWQRPEHAQGLVLEHVPFGESNALPYCGPAQGGENGPLCPINPAAVPPCKQIRSLGRRALADHAELVAYQRPAAIYARGDETRWPGTWFHSAEAHALQATAPGQLIAHIAVDSSQRYELSLFGGFDRGFEVSVDGRRVGDAKDNPYLTPGHVHVADFFLEAGVHEFVLTYPHADPLTPGSGDEEFTSLSAIVLQGQESPPRELISVPPQQAAQLCGRSLDWVELVAGA